MHPREHGVDFASVELAVGGEKQFVWIGQKVAPCYSGWSGVMRQISGRLR
jgi:hypothetical protein